MDLDWRIGVQLSQTRGSGLVSRLALVILIQKELSREVGKRNRGGIVEADALYSSERDILGNLDAEALETDDQDVGGAHALHSLVAQDIELAAVEGLIDLGAVDDRLVDLHPGREIDLGVSSVRLEK